MNKYSKFRIGQYVKSNQTLLDNMPANVIHKVENVFNDGTEWYVQVSGHTFYEWRFDECKEENVIRLLNAIDNG